MDAVPSGQLDDVPWLDETAGFVPNRNGDAPALICNFTRAHLMAVFRFSNSAWDKNELTLDTCV